MGARLKVGSLLASLSAAAALLLSAVPSSAADGAWPRYLHDNGGSGDAVDGGMTVTAGKHLKPLAGFAVKLPATISTQPVLANGLIYVGAWDGNEYAITPSGAIQWKRFLGITTKGKACQYPIGLAGTAVVAQAAVDGSERPVLYVGGGGNLDAAGRIVAGGHRQRVGLVALTGRALCHTSRG